MAVLLLALKSLLVAAATLLLLRLARHRSAAERSTIAHLGLFALVALPLASLALPSLTLTLPERMASMAAAADTPLPTVTAAPSLGSNATPSTETALPATAPQRQTAPEKPSALADAVTVLANHAYLVPTGALLLLTLVALLRLVGLRARADVLVDPVWLAAMARAQQRMNFKSGTALLRSDELASPISWGLMRPTILLSDAAARAPEQAEAIIAHELAHVIQLDWAKLMLARVATAAFWFNPLAWVLAREAHQLREEAADDAVLAANIAGPDYAELLIDVARHECRGVLLGAHGVAPGRNSLRRRVARVLDASPARGPSGRSWIAGFAAGMLTMAAPLAALTFAPSQAASNPPESAATGTLAGAKPSQGAAAVSPRDSAPVSAAAIAHDQMAIEPVTPLTGAAAQASANVEPVARNEQATGMRQKTDVDQIIEMRAAGITPEYKRAMARAGLPNLSLSQLTQARSLDLTPDYVREIRAAAGQHMNFDELLSARVLSIDPEYIGEMRKLGVHGSIDDLQGMISLGVTPEYVRRLRARGLNVTSPDKLKQLKAVDFDPDRDRDDP